MCISDGKVALFGGIEGEFSVLDDFWLYSVDQSLWMLLTPVVRPSARYNHFMAPIFSFLFLFAGRTAERTMDDVWAYKDHEWELMQGSPSSSLLADGISMAVINQATLFVNGGKLTNSFIEGVWTYNTCICPAGTEIGIHGCLPCNAGFIKNATGNQSCSPCPVNTYSSVSSTVCQDCPVHSVSGNRSQDKWNCTCIEGYGYEGGQELVCSLCPRGYAKNSVGNYACSPCPANSYTANSTKTCTPCTSNSSSPAGSWSVLNCTCNPGYIHDLVNSTTCSACPEGKYRNMNATSCITCSLSTFSDVKGASSVQMCKSCPTIVYWKWFPIASADVSLYPQFDLSESSFQLLLQQCGCNQGEGLNPSQLPYCVAWYACCALSDPSCNLNVSQRSRKVQGRVWPIQLYFLSQQHDLAVRSRFEAELCLQRGILWSERSQLLRMSHGQVQVRIGVNSMRSLPCFQVKAEC